MKKERYLMAYPLPSTDSSYGLTPLSIMMPGAMFEAKGHEVFYWDERFDSAEEFDRLIPEMDHVAVSCFTGKQSAFASDLLEKAKRIKPKVITHVGGHHARLCTKDVEAEPNVDRVWPERYYGEEHFPWSERAKKLWKRGVVQFQTSRGCPYACSFCCLRSSWYAKDLPRIERELNMIAELRGGLPEISLTDPNLGFEREKVDGQWNVHERVGRMRAMGRVFRALGVKVDGNVRSDYITPEYVDALAEAGFNSLEFGAESGSDEFLRKKIQKGHGVNSIKNANRLMHGSGISVMNSFVHSLPGETREDWLKTMEMIDWIMEAAPEARVSVYKFTPFPGGPAYNDAVAGAHGYPKFVPPKTMKGWGEMQMMCDPVYWCAGMCFREDNSRKNFPGEEWALIEPYIKLAKKLWAERRPEDFPGEQVEGLIKAQVAKRNAEVARSAE